MNFGRRIRIFIALLFYSDKCICQVECHFSTRSNESSHLSSRYRVSKSESARVPCAVVLKRSAFESKPCTCYQIQAIVYPLAQVSAPIRRL